MANKKHGFNHGWTIVSNQGNSENRMCKWFSFTQSKHAYIVEKGLFYVISKRLMQIMKRLH